MKEAYLQTFDLVDQDGSGEPQALTSGGSRRRYGTQWSPAGTHLSFNDSEGRLWLAEVETGELVEVARDPGGSISDASWSPNGGYIAFSLEEESGMSALWIYSLEERALRRVTDGTFNAEEPVWDPDGEYLYHLSDRTWAPQISSVEWNFATNRTTGIFALALRAPADTLHADRDDPAGGPERGGHRRLVLQVGARSDHRAQGAGHLAASAATKIDFRGVGQEFAEEKKRVRSFCHSFCHSNYRRPAMPER